MNLLTKISSKLMTVLAAALFLGGQALAQNISVTGAVTDSRGNPLPGASVIEVGTSNGVTTDANGIYVITVKPKAELQAVFIGMKTETVAVNGNKKINFTLAEDRTQLDEAVVVAYGVQKKATLTGSVASIGSDEIVITKNANAENMLTGKLSGLRVVQNTSEPGTFNSSISIRDFGTPLIIIDGVPRSTIGRLNGNDIESVSVIKDASAAVYGVRAADGVIIITTKQGTKDRMHITYDYNLNLSTLTGLPKPLDALSYMQLYNEESWRNYLNPSVQYTEEEMNAYRTGEAVSTDWYHATVREITPSHQHTISADGGTDKIRYYMSLGYTDQESFYKNGDLKFNQYFFRSNISADLANGLTASLNVWGDLDDKIQPHEGSGSIIRALWRQRPSDPIYANDNEKYLYKPTVDGYNPVAFSDISQVGYNDQTNKFLQTKFSLEYKPAFMKGFAAKVSLSYDTQIYDSKDYKKAYNLYTYNAATDEYIANTLNSPSQISREYSYNQQILLDASVSYDNKFGDNHVSGMVLYEEEMNKNDSFYARRYLSLDLDEIFAGLSENQQGNGSGLKEYASRAVVARFNYDYAGKYLVELSGRYDQSSKFAPSHRAGFFPGGSIGYRISEERFWKNNRFLSKINNLKLRASYGVMGRDNNLDFQFLTGYTYPTSGSVFNGAYVNGLSDKGIANQNVTWETCYTANIGLDLNAWNGLLGYSVDLFDRHRTGIFTTRRNSLPATTGADLPQENLNEERTRGWDMQASHHNHIGDFYYSLNGNVSFAYTMTLYRERAESGNSYENWYNNNSYRNVGLWWGLQGVGRYENWDEIINSPTQVGNGTLPGDYLYEDWNGDGYITSQDKHIIGYSGAPQIYYGLTFECSWKGIDFNMLWQGAARHWVEYEEILGESIWGGGNGPDYFFDRWHPVDPTADVYDPNTEWVQGTYAFGGVSGAGTFKVENAAYARLKSVELGYTFPRSLTRKIAIYNLRIYANSYNPLTFSKLKYVDPEHSSGNHGYIYPINTTYNFGVQVKF